jgi:hypothetical protein
MSTEEKENSGNAGSGIQFGNAVPNMPNIEILTKTNPTNILSGIGAGAGNIIGGALLGVGKIQQSYTDLRFEHII